MKVQYHLYSSLAGQLRAAWMLLLCLLCISGSVLAASSAQQGDKQNKVELTGRVVDSEGEPLPGVTVTLQGTTHRTGTDAEGYFIFNVPGSEKGYTLEFTFIGMKLQVRHISQPGKSIRVVMRESAEALDEVVITGMEVIKKDRMTGSATVITAKDLKMQGITSIDRIL